MQKEKRISVPYTPGDKIDQAVITAKKEVEKHIGKVTKKKSLELLIMHGLSGLTDYFESR